MIQVTISQVAMLARIRNNPKSIRGIFADNPGVAGDHPAEEETGSKQKEGTKLIAKCDVFETCCKMFQEPKEKEEHKATSLKKSPNSYLGMTGKLILWTQAPIAFAKCC